MPVKLCNNTVKYGKCNHGENCNFKSFHFESVKKHRKLKEENKCAWCFLGHCSPANCKIVPNEKKKKVIVKDEEGFITPKPVEPELTLEEKLLLWLKNTSNGIYGKMPKITEDKVLNINDKKVIFSEGKGFIIRQKTTLTIEQIKIGNKPTPMSLAWKEPPSEVYEHDLKTLLEETNLPSKNIEPEIEPEIESETDEEDDYNNQLYNIGFVQKRSAWDEFDD